MDNPFSVFVDLQKQIFSNKEVFNIDYQIITKLYRKSAVTILTRCKPMKKKWMHYWSPELSDHIINV